MNIFEIERILRIKVPCGTGGRQNLNDRLRGRLVDMWNGVEEFDPDWLEDICCTLVASGETDKISDARELLNDLVRHILAR